MKGAVFGFQFGYVPMHNKALWGFTGKYESNDNNTLLFEYS